MRTASASSFPLTAISAPVSGRGRRPPRDLHAPGLTILVAALTAVALLPVSLATEAAAQEDEAEVREMRLEAVNEGVSFRSVAYSPAEREIAFISNRTGAPRLWIADDRGERPRQLLEGEGVETEVAWSPDGESLAFVRPGEEGTDIWVVDRDGADARRVTSGAVDPRSLAWSPDGRRIAYMSARDGHQDVWLADVAAGETRQLTRQTGPEDDPRWSPEWSPDGEWIAYVSNRTDRWRQDLWLVDPDTGETSRVTTDLDVMTSPVWSPDGRHIAFNAVAEHEFWWGDQSDVYLVAMPEREVRKLRMNTHVSDRNGSVRLAWGADGDEIFFRYLWEGDGNVWRVGLDDGTGTGSPDSPPPPSAGATPAAGAPGDVAVATKVTYAEGDVGNLTVSPDGGSLVFARQTPVRGPELHRVDLAGGEAVAVTRWQPTYGDLEPARRISYRAEDGKRILGYLYLPPDFDPEGSYPAVVQAHGGGNNVQGNGFHVVEHMLSHRGFVVLAIEYRGSAGHGREFQRLSQGDWAAGQGWDAVAAARWLRSRPWSNGRVGIYGGSYGGIMTLAALTRDSEPFDAAVPIYGIYDWETAYDHGDYLMQFWIIQGHLGFHPGERPELYERTASLRHLGRVDPGIPFLVIHGELDRRAPYQQSEDLVEALEARGNPVTFISFPDEGHGFRGPGNRLEAYGGLAEFFEEHLTDAGGEDGL